MITIWAIVRPLAGEFAHIQVNAVRSWLHMDPPPQVLLFDNGRHTVTIDGVTSQPAPVDAYGVPLVNEAMWRAHEQARYPVRLFANTDNLLDGSVYRALHAVEQRFKAYVVIGQRTNLIVPGLMSFDAGWHDDLLLTVDEEGRAGSTTGMDYFLYRGDHWGDMPPLAVGQDYYDNWMVKWAVEHGVPLIDASGVMLAVHQDHAPTKSQAARADNYARAGLDGRYGIKRCAYRLTERGEIES